MKKMKNTIFGGFLIASLAFTGYSHSMASQRFSAFDSKLTEARQELEASSQSLESLSSQLEAVQTELAQEKAERVKSEKTILALRLEVDAKAQEMAKAQERVHKAEEEKANSFQDLEGVYAADTIDRLLKAGVVELGDGQFRPDESISRAEFLEWLVKATNTVNERKSQIRLVKTGEPTFDDVASDHPAFPYVEGATSSGFVIGYDETTFRPKRALSREELIAIKVSFDKAPPQMNGNCGPRYTDFEEVSPKYKQAVHNCDNGGYGSQTAAHIWGNFKTFHPKRAVTRAEAALAVERIKGKWGWEFVGKKK